MYITGVFIDEASKDMLILVIYLVEIIDSYDFFAIGDKRANLAEYFEFITAIYGTLVFEAGDMHNITLYGGVWVFYGIILVILFDDIVDNGSFSGAFGADEDKIEVILLLAQVYDGDGICIECMLA